MSVIESAIMSQVDAREMLNKYSIELGIDDNRNSQQFAAELLELIEYNLGEIALQAEIERFSPNTLTSGQKQFLNLTSQVKQFRVEL